MASKSAPQFTNPVFRGYWAARLRLAGAYMAIAEVTKSRDELLAAVRGHWHIENSVFFLKDRWWDEDRHWTKRPGLSEWLVQLTTLATMVLRLFRTDDQPLRAHADYIAWNPLPRTQNPLPGVTMQSSCLRVNTEFWGRMNRDCL